MDNEIVGENIYLNMINKAKHYVYITTPYLIIDNEMVTALTLAAKSGIVVRIITPGIQDKKLVYLVTQSYYYQLIEAGVKIYQYTPGFIHAKTPNNTSIQAHVLFYSGCIAVQAGRGWLVLASLIAQCCAGLLS